MRRALLVISMGVLWGSIAAAGMQSTAAGTFSPPPAASADPLWMPTVSSVNEWVHNGINAAADGIALQDVTGVQSWIWGYPDGVPCGRGQSLRFVIVAAPEFVATAVGWTAAWDEATWARIQLDQDEVAAGLTRGVAGRWRRGRLLVAVGIQGQADSDDGYQPTVTIHYNNAWRCRHEGGLSTLHGFAKTGGSHRGRTPLSVTARVLKEALKCSELEDAENTVVALLELELVPSSIPFDSRLPTPPVPQSGWARVAVGDPDNLGYVDLCLGDEGI